MEGGNGGRAREHPGDMLPGAWGDVPVSQNAHKNCTDTITYSIIVFKEFKYIDLNLLKNIIV